MELTQEQLQTLRGYKDEPDDDNIRIKDVCKKSLIEDPLILYLLNNKELEEADEPKEEYIGRNILNNYLIHPTQHNVQNFICLSCDSREVARYNADIKKQRVIFTVLCEEKNNREPMTGAGRHDLIAARIKHIFNWTNKFGVQCVLVEDYEGVTDNDYATRTLVFEMDTPKNLVKTRDGVSYVANKFGG